MTRMGFVGGERPEAETVEISVDLKHETAKAWLVNDGERDVWVPKSIAEFEPPWKVITVQLWFAKKEGLI